MGRTGSLAQASAREGRGEVVADAQQGLVNQAADGVGEAVAEAHCRTMSALAEARVGVGSDKVGVWEL